MEKVTFYNSFNGKSISGEKYKKNFNNYMTVYQFVIDY